MRKVALVFLLAVFLPSLVLAWLAVRSLRDQQLVLERQQYLLCQGLADATAERITTRVAELQEDFGNTVESLLQARPAAELAPRFHEEIRGAWPAAQVGFAVSLDGEVLAPSMFSGTEARRFRLENDRFLSNRESVEVYWNSPKGAISLNQLDSNNALKGPAIAQTKGQQMRNVLPQQQLVAQVEAQTQPPTEQLFSKVTAAEAEFRQIVGEAQEGSVARFLQDRLHLFFWYRSAQQPALVFGAQLAMEQVVEALRPLLQEQGSANRQVAMALLDDSGRPAVVWPAEFAGDWKRPFVATEIGEALPHWEVGVYQLDPGAFTRTADTLKLTLGLLIALLVVAIGTGSWLIVMDLRRQLALAQQKTDFVSNVSHELKTPLTSIRMFSELLMEGRVTDDEKRRSYLQIISTETARLTRLINGVLDFARMDRGERTYRFAEFDLAELVRETVDQLRTQLEGAGFRIEVNVPEAPVWVTADRDGVAQVLLNLLSNAEKYGGERREVVVELTQLDGSRVELAILDRGSGVPRGCETRIFEQFFRAHDSLASGIQGSGLGLTLARQIARAHGGEVAYRTREGGGACFLVQLPTTPPPQSAR